MPQYIAVYGTLRRGSSANDLMRGCKWMGSDEISGRLFHLGLFPACKLSREDSGETVKVDVYQLPSEGSELFMHGIDRYEGYFPGAPEQSLYTRKIVVTKHMNLEVWVYEYINRVDYDNLIKSGDWLEHHADK